MPRYSFNNIFIIVTNVMILVFLSAQFVHIGAPQQTVLSFIYTNKNMKLTKACKLLINFLFCYNDVRAFEVFK